MASVAASSTPSLLRFARNHPDDGLNKSSKKSPLWKRGRGRTQSVETLQTLPSSDNLVTTGSSMRAQLSEREMSTVAPRVEPEDATSASCSSLNLMQWLESSTNGGCPSDCVPLILAFCGPQQTAALSRTNRHWRDAIVGNEATWRVLCEELYKVRTFLYLWL